MTFWKLGDYLVQCDRSGQKCFRSKCTKEWNGLIVKKQYAESRHPLDLQRPPREEQPPRDSRPQNETFLDFGDVTRDDL